MVFFSKEKDWKHRIWYRMPSFWGYVKISGMIDENMDKDQMKKDPEAWEFKKPKATINYNVGRVTVNLLLGVLFIQ